MRVGACGTCGSFFVTRQSRVTEFEALSALKWGWFWGVGGLDRMDASIDYDAIHQKGVEGLFRVGEDSN